MLFNSAASIEQVCFSARLADWPRSQNRALIDALFNGAPPYSPDELASTGASTNVNDLSSTIIDHGARRQLWNALCVPNPLFTVNVDYGPAYKRSRWSSKITKEINKHITASPQFLDLRDGVGAGMILHGVGPSLWEDQERWRPKEIGMDDVLIPSNTLRSMENLPYYSVYRQMTAPQLYKMTHGPKVDPAWNTELVKQTLNWIDEQTRQGSLGYSWPEIWSPEKMEERWKQDSGLYAADAVPYIGIYDFYFWSGEGSETGWKRRMILDAWGQPGVGGVGFSFDKNADPNNRRFKFGRNEFLYNSEDRIYSPDIQRMIHFQFGDASAVAPFYYHSVRSLGFLLYAVCHLQNRIKCRFSDSVFESMLQYFRIANPADMDRLTKIDLVDKGILPEGLNFVKPDERWKVERGLVGDFLNLSQNTMDSMSSSFSQEYQPESGEESATLTTAKVNSAAQLVGSMLNRAYAYERFRYMEIARRFCIKDSKDPDVRKFRIECLKDGVPEEALNVDRWDIQVNKVLGNGNKMVQMGMAQGLLNVYGLHEPSAQKQILRMYDAALTDDYALADQLNPEQPHVSDSVHDTEIVFGTLMGGNRVTPKPGLNQVEVVETMLQLMAAKIAQINQSGGVGTPQDIVGLQSCAAYTQSFIDQLVSDPNQKAFVKEAGDAMGQLSNQVKAFAQRQQEAAMQAQAQGPQQDPKTQAQVDAIRQQSQAKAQVTLQKGAESQAQKSIAFEKEQLRRDAQNQAEIQRKATQAATDEQIRLLEAANAPKPDGSQSA